MGQTTEAVYTEGVLKPTERLALREAQRVRLIIEILDDPTDSQGRSAAVERLRAGIDRMSFRSKGHLPARDELHNRP